MLETTVFGKNRSPIQIDYKSWLPGVLFLRNFRLLWLGEGISLLGDQFYIIALPWLVLQLSGDAFATGTVLAMAGIPRALFMLLGGALTDRFSPRTLMLNANLARMGLVGLLAGLVLAGVIEVWMLYPLALAFGLVDAFFYPAQNAMLPQLVARKELKSGNAIIWGTAQLGLFVGPVLAGTLIALLDGPRAQAVAGFSNRGIGLAFGIDALTFLISAVTLQQITLRDHPSKSNGPQPDHNVLSSIYEGLATVWNDVTLRAFFFVGAAMSFLVNGPISVGIPVLANGHFQEGAAAYGIIMGGFGAGALLGTIVAGALPKPQRLGTVIMGLVGITGIGVALMGFVATIYLAALITFTMGGANGYITVQFFTWLQSRTPQMMLGRIMGLLMFVSIGLAPVSMTIAGVLMALHATLLFVVCGTLLALIVGLSTLNPAVRSMETTAAAKASHR